jgi:hypothetical protein
VDCGDVDASQAVSMQLASQYINAFGNVAQKGTTVLLPSNTNDPAAMVGAALGIFKTLAANPGAPPSPPAGDAQPADGASAAALALQGEGGAQAGAGGGGGWGVNREGLEQVAPAQIEDGGELPAAPRIILSKE